MVMGNMLNQINLYMKDSGVMIRKMDVGSKDILIILCIMAGFKMD